MGHAWIVVVLLLVGCKKGEGKHPEAVTTGKRDADLETAEDLRAQLEQLESDNDLKGAVEAARKLVATQRARRTNDEEALEWALYSYGRALAMAGEPLRAERALREGNATAKSEVLRAALAYQLGGVMNTLGRPEEAVTVHREAHALYVKLNGATSDEALAALEALGGSLDHAGKSEEAEALFRQSVKAYEPQAEDDPRALGHAVVNLASNLDTQGRGDEALVQFRRAVELLETTEGYERAALARAHAGVAGILYDRGKYVESERAYRKALAIHVESLGAYHPSVAFDHHNLALVLEATSRLEEALIECNRALSIRWTRLGQDNELARDTEAACARIAAAQDQAGE